MIELKYFIDDFAQALHDIDRSGVVHKSFRPGIGPFGEITSSHKVIVGIEPKLSESLAGNSNAQSKVSAAKKDDFFDLGPDNGQAEKFKPSFLQNSRKFTPGPNAFVKRDPQVDLMQSVDLQPTVSKVAPVAEDRYDVGLGSRRKTSRLLTKLSRSNSLKYRNLRKTRA